MDLLLANYLLTYTGRNDLNNYELGYRDGVNFFVDWRGSVHSRPGTELVEPLDGTNNKLHSFSFNQKPEDNYLLVFTPTAIRFIQDGAYVTESEALEIENFSVEAENYGKTFRCYKQTGEYLFTSTASETDGSLPVLYADKTETINGYPVYEVNHSFPDFNFTTHQYNNELVITHPEVAPQKLVYTSKKLLAINSY